MYRKSHYGEKTILKPSCLHNGISYTGKMTSLYWISALAAIPLKSIPMSRHLPEMPAECQTVQMCLPLTALALCWHCADLNCLFSWPWWRHRECSDPRDTKCESKVPSTLLTPLLRSGLLRALSTLTFGQQWRNFHFTCVVRCRVL